MKKPNNLRELYLEKELTRKELSELFGISSRTVGNWLKDSRIKKTGNIPSNLKELYCSKKLSQEQIAKVFQVSQQTVGHWLRKRGIKSRPFAGKGPEHSQWKGGKLVDKRTGRVRVYCPNHRRTNKRKNKVFRAILVWEKTHKKRLPPGYIIHHKDCNPGNDHPSNLQKITPSKHRELHIGMKKNARARNSS